MPWKLSSLGFVVAVAMLVGCTTKPQTDQATAAETDATQVAPTSCTSTAASFAVGQKASPQLLEQARIRSGAWSARLLKPDSVVTLEYRSDRLNLNTDDNLTVTRVNCG